MALGSNEIPMDAKVYESPARIDLRFFNPGTFKLYRKNPASTTWGTEIATVTVSAAPTTWSDTNVVVGELYEYGIGATTTTKPNYFGNVLAGIKVDRTQPRGRIALVVAEDIPAKLPLEYAQYKADLVADGWVVHEITTPRAADYLSNATATNALATVTVTAGGTGYTTGKNVVLTNGTATALGTLTVASGAVTAVAVNYSGGGFSAGDSLTFTGDSGTGATLTVATVTSGTAEHINIRNQLISLYNTYPGELKNVVLIGKVAVARSGKGYVGPDGHGNRASVGADAYYADMDGVWTDTGNNYTFYTQTTSPTRSDAIKDGRINVPGDNKFDATYFYEVTTPNSRLELGFGRIDFSNSIPAEYESMRQYFNKLHRYKVASADFQPGRRVCNRLNAPPTGGTVQTEMLRSMPGLVGMENIQLVTNTEATSAVPPKYSDDEDRDSAYTRIGGPFLFYFKGSGGPDWAPNGRAVFWTGLQSNWGYWFESGNNTMLRRLAEDNFALSFTWSIWGTDFLYHRMGMGFDVGDMMRLSLNERTSSVNNYPVAVPPTGFFANPNPLFMNHMGCPSLRLFMFPPPTALSVVKSGGDPSLSWTAAVAPPVGEPQVIGYHVYRAASANGPFTRLTSVPVAGTSYVDASVNSGAWTYQVKAVRLETTGGGTYYNTSLGVQQSIDLTNGPAELVVSTTSLSDAYWNTPYEAALNAIGGTPIYNWSLVSGSLPPGLTLSARGAITGKATTAGTYSFTLQVADQAGQSVQKAFLISVQSNSAQIFYAEANSYCGSYNTTTWGFDEASLLMAGPPYLYQPFLRFDLSNLDFNNSFTRAKLVLTLDERSQANSYAMVKAALTEDIGDAWLEANTATKSITGVANNGVNQTRVTCPGHGMTTQTTATTTIAGVTGTNKANANGSREVTIIDGDTFDLPTVAYDSTLVWTLATSAPANGLSYAKRPLDNKAVPEVYASSFPVAYGTIELDVTDMVRFTLANDPSKKLGLRLYTTLGNSFGNEVRIVTRYAPDNASPRLVVETTDAPAITFTSPTINPACIHMGSSLVINATVVPIPAQAGAISVQWSKQSGPGTVVFSSSNTASTMVDFSSAGDYILRLSAQDGALNSYKELAVRVLAIPETTAPATGPTDGLILRLPFDEGAGTAVADVSGSLPANNGAFAALGASGLPTWKPDGKIGSAVNFNGTGQRVEVPDSATLDNMQKMTASLWVKINGADTNAHAILVKRNSSASSTSYAITLTSAEKVAVSVANKTAINGDNVLVPGEWYHVAMVYDGSLATNNLQLYLNGSPEKFGTVAATPIIPRNIGAALRVGDYASSAVTAGLNGQVDEVRLYNRVLTLSEIQDLAQAKPANMGPKIALASASVSGPVGTQLALGATVTDDGLPGAVTLGWSKASGPGSVVFSNPVSGTTNATTSAAGSYALRITANDGSVTTFADVAASFEASGGIDNWRLLHFGTTENSGEAADGANPKKDGLSNLLKYVLGLDPNVDYRGSALAPKGQLENLGAEDRLTFTFTRDTAVTDATLLVEVVNDLNGTWTTIDPLNPANQVEVLENTPSAGIQTITVKDTQPVTAATKRFMRLKVTRP